jgi:putative ABC transport system permease protein
MILAWLPGSGMILLQPYHINQYLNLLTLDPSAVLISRSLFDHYNLELGDTLNIGWSWY